MNVGDTAKIRGRPTRRSAALTLDSGNSEQYAFLYDITLHSFVERLSSQLIRGGWILSDMQSSVHCKITTEI